MLVLSRERGEAIWIGDSIRLVVVDVGGGHVRLGIEAERSVPIVREELLERDKEAA